MVDCCLGTTYLLPSMKAIFVLSVHWISNRVANIWTALYEVQ